MYSHPIKCGVATAVLLSEHETIMKALALLEKATYSHRDGVTINPVYFDSLLEIFSLFADKCHHGKEEEVLFPALLEHGVVFEDGPVEILLEEHESGRICLRRLKEGVALLKSEDSEGTNKVVNAAIDYVSLLREHIMKEDEVFLVVADRVLDEPTQQEVVKGFEKLDIERMGEGTLARLHALLDDLEQQAADW